MSGWYAIRTQPRREAVAETWLANFCDEVFCPRHKVRVNVHGYRREVPRPLFPSYLFAAFDPARNLRAVRYCHGVRDVVRFGQELARVPEDLLRAIRARMREGYVVLDPPPLRPGQRVEVTEGPFRGYQGIFQRELTGGRRVAILLDTLRMSARAILEREAVRPAP
jgi:transcriptional antiterminator RfaH